MSLGNLEQQINDGIKAAMLAKEKTRLESLRAIKAAILLEKSKDGAESLSDQAVVKLIQKLVKQRKESAEIYAQQNRPELAENELAEMAAMEPYLPKQLTEAEIESVVREVIAQVGASGPQDMGKVMGAANKQLAGQADGRMVSEIVKRLLN
ncbi:MAG: GatB/YqeY domain-containing protein [Rikenellaceae bacterium]|jgi:uncharacterized protein YqeY|nr:GatB/YqeY domain-containing protein [Rikenellaceae bacterium]